MTQSQGLFNMYTFFKIGTFFLLIITPVTFLVKNIFIVVYFFFYWWVRKFAQYFPQFIVEAMNMRLVQVLCASYIIYFYSGSLIERVYRRRD